MAATRRSVGSPDPGGGRSAALVPAPGSPAITTRRVFFVLFPGAEIMDVAGPLQALHEAAALGVRYGLRYESRFCGATPTARTAQGLEMTGLQPLPDVGPGDRIIVPGYPVAEMRPPAKVVSWLRRAHAAGAELCSVCTGTFALGEAGLLDGTRCTTHWRRVPDLRARFPRARVVEERIFVEDGRVISSAGIATGIDMMLALLERDGGPVLAAEVAREMVIYMRRDGAYEQESVYLDFQTHLQPGVHRLQRHLIANPTSRASLGELARTAGMSARNLTRVFKRATGISIHDYRTRLRLERARTLLRNPMLSLEAIAAACGFAGARQLRRAWSAEHGEPPAVTRERSADANGAHMLRPSTERQASAKSSATLHRRGHRGR